MKKTTILLTTSIAFFLMTGPVNASSLKAMNSSSTTKICIAAAKGSRARLHIKIKDSGLSKAFVTNKVKCNNQDITVFVQQHGKAPKVINKMLNKYKKNKT